MSMKILLQDFRKHRINVISPPFYLLLIFTNKVKPESSLSPCRRINMSWGNDVTHILTAQRYGQSFKLTNKREK